MDDPSLFVCARRARGNHRIHGPIRRCRVPYSGRTHESTIAWPSERSLLVTHPLKRCASLWCCKKMGALPSVPHGLRGRKQTLWPSSGAGDLEDRLRPLRTPDDPGRLLNPRVPGLTRCCNRVGERTPGKLTRPADFAGMLGTSLRPQFATAVGTTSEGIARRLRARSTPP